VLPTAALKAVVPGALTVIPTSATRKTVVSQQRYAVTNRGKASGRYAVTG
ncbi:unnamed protein product, partial [marine sediment metagenome]